MFQINFALFSIDLFYMFNYKKKRIERWFGFGVNTLVLAVQNLFQLQCMGMV
jgi:hypothetical protein